MGQFVSLKMPVEQWFSYIYAGDMPKNCPRYIQDMPEIRASFAQGMGIHIEKVGQNVTGDSMGGKWGVGKKEMCHRPHGVLITITKHGEQKKLVIGHEKPPTTPT